MNLKLRVFDKKRNDYIHNLDDMCDIMYSNGQWYFCGGEKLDDNFIIEQSIGIKDLNGVEIFEGDVIENLTSYEEYCSPALVSRAVYEEIGWALSFKDTRALSKLECLTVKVDENLKLTEEYMVTRFGNYKVIGNIHHNKELFLK